MRIVQIELNNAQKENKELLQDKRHLLSQNEILLNQFIRNYKLIPIERGQFKTTTELKELISNGYIDKAIDALKERPSGKVTENELVIISSQYKGMIHDYNAGIIDGTERFIRLSRIRVSLLDFIDKVEN